MPQNSRRTVTASGDPTWLIGHLLLREPTNAKAASYASNPDLIAHFYRNSTQLEEIIPRIVHKLLDVKRRRFHLRDTGHRQFAGTGIITTSDMAGNHYVSISSPTDVIHVESYWGRINLYRGLPP